jgi:NADPH:quinone reductase-like Zn-dependent oxidoreductase
MKAIICPKYGSPDVLQLQELVKPVPQEDEVLIQIHAASLNSRDLRFLRAKPFFIRLTPGGIFRPKNKVLGADFAGRIESVGSNVRQFKPGDEVFGFIPAATGRGTFAEYVSAKENAITLKPANLTFEQAAAVPLAAMTALQGLRDDGNIQPGQKVLIHGASGGVGTYAVQIAKALGAEVTAVCSTRNLKLMRSLGADHVIDYKVEDFTQNGQQYDLILAVNGYHPIADYLRALKPEGNYVVVGGSMAQLFQAASYKKRNSDTWGQKTVIASLVQSQKDLVFIKELVESGKIMPIIDGCYPLSQTSEAFWYLEKVHPMGKVVIIVQENLSLQEDQKVRDPDPNRYIAYCGNDCTQCPQYQQDCAEGCLGTTCANYCGTCIVRLCNLERHIANCAQCEEYPCQKLETQFENMAKDGFSDWAMIARRALIEIRQS